MNYWMDVHESIDKHYDELDAIETMALDIHLITGEPVDYCREMAKQYYHTGKFIEALVSLPV